MSADILALVLRLSLAMSAAILVVLALRGVVRAAFGARIAYALWLIAPVATIASLLPARLELAETPADGATAPPEFVDTGIGVGIELPETAPAAIDSPIAWDMLAIDAAPVLMGIWIIGVIASLVALAYSQRQFLAREAGPAVVGIVRPRIIVPADFDLRYTAEERRLVLAHERAHIAAGDAQVNALAAFVQCISWFNPLVHVARAALRVDQELACDARVMARHAGARRVYAEAMLKTQLAAQHVPLGCAWPPSGLNPLKERISMLTQSPSLLRRALGAASCALLVGCVGVVAWAAQPARPAHAEARNSFVASALGARLVEALKEGERDDAIELISHGANVDHWTPGDGTPLIVAAQNGDRDVARRLLTAGADVNKAANGDGNPLIVAAAQGDVELAQMFVEAGANVNGFVSGDETPLINAARENALDVARYLIAQGADVNLEVEAPTVNGSERRSPMSVARQRGHQAMIALLRQHGARG